MPAKLFVEIVVSKSGDIILKGLKGDIGDLNKKLKDTHKITTELTSAFKLLGAAFAVNKIWKWTKEWVTLSAEMDKANRLLMQASFNAGKFTGEVHKNSLALARQQQTLSGFHRSIIIGGMKIITTFDEITNDLLPRATQAMLDYAAFTGVNMFSAAKAIGKASMGLLGDLKRVGAQVRESTYDAEGFIGILKELEVQMSGQAAAMMRSFAGSWLNIKNLIKDVKIELGDFINTIVIKTGALDVFANHLKDVANYLNDISDTDIEAFLTRAGGAIHGVMVMLLGGFKTIAAVVGLGVEVLAGAVGILDRFMPKMSELIAAIEELGIMIGDLNVGKKITGAVKDLAKWLIPDPKMTLTMGGKQVFSAAQATGKEQEENLLAPIVKNLEKIPAALDDLAKEFADALKEFKTWVDEPDKLKPGEEKLTARNLYDVFNNFGIDMQYIFKNFTDGYWKQNWWEETRVQSVINNAQLGYDIQSTGAYGGYDASGRADLLQNFGGLRIPRPPGVEPDIALSEEKDRIKLIWDEYAKSMTKTFENAWVKMLSKGEINFESFFISLKATMATALLKQTFYDAQGNLTTIGKWGMGIGAGYSAYEQGDAGLGAFGGGMAGAQIGGGPMGAGVGAFLGGALGAIGGLNEDRARASVTTFWEIIDGEVKLVSDKWVKSAKSQKVLDRMQHFFQTQVDFFTQANLLLKGKGIEGVSLPELQGIAAGSEYDYIYKHMTENLDKYTAIFGDKINDYLEATAAGETGKFPGFWDSLIEEFQEASDLISQSLGNALLASLETGDFDIFKDTLKKGLYEATVQALTEAFVKRELIEQFFEKMGVTSMFDIIGQYGRGEISETEAITGIKTAFAKLPEILEELEPVWEAFNTGMSSLQIALGINTEALYSNIESLRDYINTIQDTIHSLTVSDLAPALSQKVFAAEYERLLGGAGSQEGLDDFVRYIQSEYLPFMRDYATDYAGSFEKVIEDLRTLEEEPKDEIADILTNIYENLGGDSNSLVTTLKELQITGVHINEEDLEKLGLRVENGIIVSMTASLAQQADYLNTESGRVPEGNTVQVINGELVVVDNASGDVLGPMTDYIPRIVRGGKL